MFHKHQIYLNLQLMMTCIISWMSLNFSQNLPVTVELAVLEHLKCPHIFIMALS